MRKKSCFLTPLYLLFIYLAYGQEPVMQHFTVENGLSSSTIYKVFQDSHGYMWFGTDAGLDKFNGIEFINYGRSDGLPDPIIYNIYEDLSGKLWLISSSGKLSYYLNNRFESHPFNGIVDKYRVKGIVSNKDGSYYITTDLNNIFKIRNNKIIWKDSLKRASFDGGLWDLLNVKENVVGIGGFGFGFIKKETLYENPFARERSYARLRTENIHDTCFFSYMNAIGFLKDTIQKFLPTNDFQNKEVFDFQTDDQQNIWVGTKEGAYEYKDTRFVNPLRSVLNNLMVSSIARDHEGNMWFGTSGEGVYLLSRKSFNNYSLKTGLRDDHILSVTVDYTSGAVWAGDNSGNIYSLKDGNIFYYSVPYKDYLSRVTHILSDSSGNVVAATDHALILFRDQRVYRVIFFSSLKRIAFKKDTIYAASSAHGINRTSFSEFMNCEGQYAILPGINGANAIFVNGDSLYFNSKQGVFKYANGKLSPLYHNILSDKIISCICAEPNGTLWIGTKGDGVLRIQGSHFKQYSIASGLSNNFCNDLFIHGNDIWIATNRGLNRIELSKPASKPVHIGFNEGLPSDEVNAVYVDKFDRIWVATNKGFAYNDSKNFFSKIAPPLINIEGLLVNNKKYTSPDSVTLPYDSNRISIKFSGISFLLKNNLTYIYKMEGFDTSWISTSLPAIQYASLPAGHYTFLVKAVAPDGTTSLRPSKLAIYIQKPFWQKGWFILLIILGVLASFTGIGFIIFSIIRFNEKKKAEVSKRIAESEIKALRAQMNPHFLFNSMNSIQHYILKSDKKSANEYLAKFAKLMRMMLDNSKKQSISLYDEIIFLRLYLELESLRFENKLTYSILYNNLLPLEDIQFPSMIIQPVVENAIKHGIAHKKAGGNIQIKFQITEDVLCCIIKDNGIGRGKAKIISEANAEFHTGTGLNTTLDRINLLSNQKDKKATMKINDLINGDGTAEGTEIEITIPLSNN